MTNGIKFDFITKNYTDQLSTYEDDILYAHCNFSGNAEIN